MNSPEKDGWQQRSIHGKRLGGVSAAYGIFPRGGTRANMRRVSGIRQPVGMDSVMASDTLDTFRDILQVNRFDMQGSAMVVNSQGVVIVNQGDGSFYNFSQTLKKNRSVGAADRERFMADISGGKSGVLTYAPGDTTSMLYDQPLGINDRSILISVPADAVTYKTTMFLKGIAYAGGAIAVLISCSRGSCLRRVDKPKTKV